MRDEVSPPLSSHATERERWELVQRIFYAAVEVSDASRDGFVRQACEGDGELEAEVKALLEADQAAVDYMEKPLVEAAGLASIFDAPLAPGDVLCDRFEIVRSIAEGGMGHVFEALDRELNVRIAVKVIRPEIAGVPEALARFRQEVRLARTITHPNVCRTFDIDREVRRFADGRQSEVVFLTMELLAGETLAAKIKRDGALKLEEAALLAGQMASALDAAHALGVVHRDMKPANVMLVPTVHAGTPGFEVRAVITDFGLARIDPVVQAAGLGSVSQTSLGKTGQPIGTLAYMAPEQLEGAAVSPATDVYGFGLILFEMVTGRRAFPSENLLTGLTQRLTGAPPAAKDLVLKLPARWSYAIEGCLRVNAAERLQRAGEVAAVLAGRGGRLGMLRQGVRAATKTRGGRWLAGGAALLVSVSLFAGGMRLYQQTTQTGSAAKVTAGALVYLVPVRNETGEPLLDNVTELLEAGLAQSAQINLLDQGKVGDILEHMTKPPDTKIDATIAREIAMRAGAVRVVFATISGGKGSYKMDVEVQQPDNSPGIFRKRVANHFLWKSDRDSEMAGAIAPELLGAVREANDWVRHEVGESAGDIARLDVPPEDVTTGSWEALAAYAEAERLVANRQEEKAVILLQNAVKADPGFASAYGRLADVLDSISREAEGYEANKRALDVTLQNRLSRRERDRILGMFALDTGDNASAEAAFRDYATYYERDYAGWFFRAHPLIMLGRTPEAIETLKHAYALDPNRISAPAHLARYFMIEGNLAEAWRWQAWLGAHEFKDDAGFVAGQLFLQEQKYPSAEQAFHGLLASDDPYYRSLGESLLVRYFAERGDFAQALREAQAGIALDKANGFVALESSKLADTAALHCKLGQPADVVAAVKDAITLRKDAQAIIASASVLGQCAAAQPLSRRRFADALHWLSLQLPKPDESLESQVAAYRVQGEFLLARGLQREALLEFSRADRLEPPMANREYLARAYRIASANVQDKQSPAYAARSLALYRELANQAGMTWYLMLELNPGVYADSLAAYLRLANRSSDLSAEDVRRLTSAYLALRSSGPEIVDRSPQMLVH